MIAIGGAIGVGLFLGSQFAISLAGPSVLLSYCIGALIALMLMGCMVEMTLAHPTSGSFGAWAEIYISPLAGFLVRVSYWSGNVFAVGTEVAAIAVYMHFWFAQVQGWVWISGFGLLLILVNLANVALFGTVEYLLSALKVLAILMFIVLGIWMAVDAPTDGGQIKANVSAGLRNYVDYGGFFPKGVSGMWEAVLVALFSYFSIETIAIAAGESREPQRAVKAAFRATLFRLFVFYVVTLALIITIVPWPLTASGKVQSPFITVLLRSHIPHAAGVVNFIILAAALSAINSQLYSSARMLFSLSRSGFAPRALGQITKRGAPLPALLVSSVGIGVAAVANYFFHDKSFFFLVAISVFGPLFTWLMIFVTHLVFRREYRSEARSFQMWGYPYTSFTGAFLMCSMLLTTIFTQAFRPTLIYGVPLLVVLSAVYALQRKRSVSSN